jgi:cation-transporting ATPase 13A1
MFECTVVGQRLRNLRELRSLTAPKQALQVYRQGKWVQLPGDALLPGDVISIGRPSGGAGENYSSLHALCLYSGPILRARLWNPMQTIWCPLQCSS